jgi:subtilisin
MLHRFRFLTVFALAVALVALGIVSSRSTVNAADAGNGPGDIVPGRYIVVLENGASPRDIARSYGLAPAHVYRHALNGFAATIPSGRLVAIQSDPRVAYVTADRVDRVLDQTTPTGIQRIFADDNPQITIDGSDDLRVDVDIAIIDTGISPHEDLNVVANVSFVGGGTRDGYGHGTHVAGTAAAIDNGTGVVGVAPGARLWNVKVCNNGGICFRSDIVAGLEYVTENADQIEVANISLGGGGSDDGNCGLSNNDPEHTAVCSAVAAGVVIAVAAGNEESDASGLVPAAYDEVITVSALADFDGEPGALASPTCRSDEDDTLANFSNFGADVDIAAPGVCILSTWKDGGTHVGSGTSMATPHVAGAAALLASGANDPQDGDDVLAIRQTIIAKGNDGWTDDSGDSTQEPLLDVSDPIFAPATVAGSDTPLTDIAVTAVSAPTSVVQGDVVDVSVTVENVGNQDVTSDVTVTLSDNTDSVTIGTKTIAGLTAGASATVTYSWDTSGASLGDHTLIASHDFADEDASNDSSSTVVTVGQDEGNGGGVCPPGNPNHWKCS